MKWNLLALTIGFVLDLLFGDPRWLYHPVRAIGFLITRGEKGFRKVFPKTERGELTAGIFFAVCHFPFSRNSFSSFAAGFQGKLLAFFRPDRILGLSAPGGQIFESGKYESV